MKTVEWLVAFFNRRTATVADRRSKRSESPVVLGFDPTNPEVVKWAATSSMAHVPGINDNTGAALREVLARGFREGNRPANIAREIGGLIGLAPEQKRELDGYRRAQAQELTSKHPRRSAATLEGLVEKRVSRYRQRLLRDRALALVRSETIRVSSARQTSHWERAKELGYLGDDARMIWRATADMQTCPVCLAIPAMNPAGVPIGGLFQTPAGPVAHPPACPQCRCGTALSPGHGGVLRFEGAVQRCMHCGAQVISSAVVCPRCDQPPVRRIVPGIND